jgi:hypothetical protein
MSHALQNSVFRKPSGYGVVPTFVPGVAAHNAPNGHCAAFEDPMFFYCFVTVV